MTLKERIIRNKEGKIIFDDFYVEFNDTYVRNVLSELVKEGKLVRLARGVYYRPIHTRLGILYPQVEEVVAAIAKRDHARILPTGNTALHQLGFTSQVPMNYEFLTNGSAREISLGKRVIHLKRAVPSNFSFRGKLMPMLHQAMRTIGKDSITKNDVAHITHLLLAHPEPKTWKHDVKLLPAWERNIVQPITRNYHE